MADTRLKSFQIDLSSTLGGDFNVSTPLDGQVLTFSSGQWVNSAGGSGAFTLDTDGNLFAGFAAGGSLTAGSPALGGAFNFLAGRQAGTSLTTADYSIFIGHEAGRDSTTSNQNILIGYQAGANGDLTTGVRNIALGSQALYNMTTNAQDNVAIGYQASYRIISSAVGNTCIGYKAGYGVRLGSSNVCIGRESGPQGTGVTTATNNVCIGRFAGNNITTSTPGNVLIGGGAGESITTGSANVCIGLDAGQYITGASGSSNIVIGDDAGPTSGGGLETTGFKLYIDMNNGPSDTPLIFGDFTADYVTINGDLDATGNVVGHIDINAQTGTSYTLVLTDDGKMITMDNASSNILYVPPESSVDFPIGTQIIVEQEGAGTTSISGGSPAIGVTLHSAAGLLSLSSQYSTCTLIKKAADTWVVAGDLA